MRAGFLDWDCAGAISLPDMAKALQHIRANGTFPVSSFTAISVLPSAASRVLSSDPAGTGSREETC